MSSSIMLEERAALPEMSALHQAVVRAFADPAPIAIDATRLREADFSLAQLLAATRIEADRCGRTLVWHGAENPVLVSLFERSGLPLPAGPSDPSCPDPSCPDTSCHGDPER